MGDDEHALPLLWDAKMGRVEQLPLDPVAQSLQGLYDYIEVCPVLVEHPPHVLENGDAGAVALHRPEVCRESIPVVPIATLVPVH